MKILIEEQYYPAELVRELCGDFGEPNQNGDIKVSRVGYFFNPVKGDCVICLPKVVMFKENNEYKAFGKYNPADLINALPNDFELEQSNINVDKSTQNFIRDFALWSYRTISTFARLNPDSEIVYQSGTINREESTPSTLLETILMLIKFYNENKDYFMYVIKNIHSGYNRVNWRKTISRKIPVIQKGAPFYMDVINRQKTINFEEELMIIFYSILNYAARNLGFDIRLECNYDLITGAEFDSYKEELGLIRLRAIKYKYFSDKDLQMWKLCYAFFEATSKISSSDNSSDYLFVTNFDRVFESMMNALISDKNVHKKLIEQKDGKIIDHIFLHESPIDGQKVYYIGDSKYYKTEDDVKGTSLYKQHTYAKNIIQFFIDKINKNEEIGVKYRDKISEGYNFTPNFFISAYIPDELTYETSCISHRTLDREDSQLKHFPNRLFDRDTLWLSHYDINLLYIMSLYANEEISEQSAFKQTFRKLVHKNFKNLLSNIYEFFWVTPEKSLSTFIEENFYILNGRIYIPKEEDSRFLMALEWKNTDKEESDESITMKQILQSKGAIITPIKDLNI